MRILIGLELNYEGRALAWALDFPGCFAFGSDGTEAVIALARELVAYEQWVNCHAGFDWLQLGDFDLRVVDTWEVFSMNDQYELDEVGYAVNAWFRHDWKPLEQRDVERGLDLLRWSREDMLRVVEGLSEDQMIRKLPDERWSIRGILKHVGSSEWWYLDRLDLAGERKNLPDDPFERLQLVRTRLEAVLPELVGKEQVLGKDGEFWSPRKLLRRAVAHEIDHRQHILKLLS